MEYTTNQKGEIAKLKVELLAASKGFVTSRTVEGARYDLVIDDGQRLHRVQVKWADIKSTQSSGAYAVGLKKHGRDGSIKKYTKDEIDAVVVYFPGWEKICWFGPELFHEKGSIMVRGEVSKNGQKKGIHYINDYLW